MSLADTAALGRRRLRALLDQHGAVVLSGFARTAAADLTRMADTLCGGATPYIERSTPRRELADNVYSVTEYPAHQRIDLHNENAYAHEWPGTLLFWCLKPADSGGENLLADTRRVLDAISPATRQAFRERGVLYARELGPPLGMAWQTVFQCSDRDQVEVLCRARGYRIQWRSPDSALLSRRGESTIRHPLTGQDSWFNHALFFHESSLDPDIRDGIARLYGADYLPHRSFFGDGAAIGPGVLEELRAAYRSSQARLLLAAGDVLVIDNLLMAHGRCPYEGRRDIRLVMGGTLR